MRPFDPVPPELVTEAKAAFMNTARFSVWVNGELAHEQVLWDLDQLEALSEVQAQLCAEASNAGLAWMVEIRFNDGDHVRFGTDRAGMIEPLDLVNGVDSMMEILHRRWGV